MKILLLIVVPILMLFNACKKDAGPIAAENIIPFSGVPSPDSVVIYEVNQRAFSTSGNLAGVTERLDAIKAIGTNVIWLMPVYPIGVVKSVNSPYCVKNYKAVNPEFGSLGDLKRLVDEAHKRNMAVVLDWVANHTSWDNPWISNKSWYTQDSQGNIVIPPGTNWQDVADLNFDNREMRAAMIDAMKYWIVTANIDGYRCDAADMVPYDFWKDALDSLKQLPSRKLLFIAEGSRTDHYNAGFHFTYSWDFYTKLKQVIGGNASAVELITTHAAEYGNIPAGKHKMRFTTNHDQSAWEATPITLFNGKRGAVAASVAAIFVGGKPMIYGGQETGREQKIPFFSNSPIDWNLNSDLQNEYRTLLSVYNNSFAAKTGNLSLFPDNNILCFARKNGNSVLYVAVNMRNAQSSMPVPTEFTADSLVNKVTGLKQTFSGSINLAPYEYLLIGSR